MTTILRYKNNRYWVDVYELDKPEKPILPENVTDILGWYLEYEDKLDKWENSKKTYELHQVYSSIWLDEYLNEIHYNLLLEGNEVEIASVHIKIQEIYEFNQGNYYNTCIVCTEKFQGAKKQPVCLSCCDKEYAYLKIDN